MEDALDSGFGISGLWRKKSKGQIIAENKARGEAAERSYVMKAQLDGLEVERTGRGSDFKVRRRDPFTGKVVYTGYREIKSGNAQLSDLQKETKRKKSNYKVIREDPLLPIL